MSYKLLHTIDSVGVGSMFESVCLSVFVQVSICNLPESKMLPNGDVHCATNSPI